MTNPPARSAWMRLALSAAARLGVAKPSAPHRPENSASAASARLDRIGIVRLLQIDGWDISGAVSPSPIHCRRLSRQQRPPIVHFYSLKRYEWSRAPYIARRDRASCTGPSAAAAVRGSDTVEAAERLFPRSGKREPSHPAIGQSRSARSLSFGSSTE